VSRVVVLVTYTMLNPIVGGAFFRALRLALELHERGWLPVICNSGPMLDDPKVEAARGKVRLVELAHGTPGFDARAAARQFAAFEPEVVVMGESPFETTQALTDGARLLARPTALLDQYYRPTLMPDRAAADVILLYGLGSLWGRTPRLRPPYYLVPPFIAEVTPPEQLPLPRDFPRGPRITLVAYEASILRAGIKLLAGLPLAEGGVIVISPLPALAAGLLREAGLGRTAAAVLPPQPDAVLFGCLRSSQVSLLSNGFIQVMDSLALRCPAIALKRGNGVGMNWINYDDRFYPFISFEESEAEQRAKIERWLEQSPFPRELLPRLDRERNGAAVCADRVEALAARRPARTWLGRIAQRVTHDAHH
jgi:hypothetical protein